MKKKEEFKPTNSQIVLVEKLKNFLAGPERIFLLTGKPGVGKTTITKICLKDYINSDIETQASGSSINVAGIALAHQAKKVLGLSIPNVFTFASAYGLKEVFHDDGSRSFEYNQYQEETPVGECAIPVFVHDEVSQYTPEMQRIVLEKTPMFSKIIFIGDKAQLPPIDPEGKMRIDQDSTIFDLELPEECKHELLERVRQTENNPILKLSDIIREEIFGSQNIKRILEAISVPQIHEEQGYSFVSYLELNEHLKDKSRMETALIAFRRKTVEHFNIDIRNFLLGNPEDSLVSGDMICMLDNYYHKEGNDILYVLHNSDVFKIKNVFTKNIKHSTDTKHYSVQVYVGNIEGDNRQIFVPTMAGWKVYAEAIKEMAELCNKGKMRWDMFWNFKKKFCNCSYAYALTCYKAQGSTYRSVYVDINDILLTKPLTPKRKLQTIYTAITRASHDVYFLKGRP